MATFKISGPDINVEDIMRKIKKNIAAKKKAGIYPESLEDKLNMPLPETSNIQEDPLAKMNITWDINPNIITASRRPIFGPIEVLIKKLILRIIGWPMNGIIQQQIREFNADTVEAMRKVFKKLEELNNRQQQNEEKSLNEINELLIKIETLGIIQETISKENSQLLKKFK